MAPDEGKPTLEFANTLHPIALWKTLLYIGVHPYTFGRWNGHYFLEHINANENKIEIDIVEMRQKNIDVSKAFEVVNKYNINYICARIEDYLKSSVKKYDCIIWWHGPEHLPKEESLKVIMGLEDHCNGIIIMGCPCGEDPYDAGYDKHYWVITDKDFADIGYQTLILNRLDRGNPVPAVSAFKKVSNIIYEQGSYY